MNRNSFQFPVNLNNVEKHNVVKSMIIDPRKQRKWWKIGVEFPIEEKKFAKEKIRQNVLNYVKKNEKWQFSHILRTQQQIQD